MMKGNWIFNAFFIDTLNIYWWYIYIYMLNTLNPSVQFSLIIVGIRQAKISKKNPVQLNQKNVWITPGKCLLEEKEPVKYWLNNSCRSKVLGLKKIRIDDQLVVHPNFCLDLELQTSRYQYDQVFCTLIIQYWISFSQGRCLHNSNLR